MANQPVKMDYDSMSVPSLRKELSIRIDKYTTRARSSSDETSDWTRSRSGNSPLAKRIYLVERKYGNSPGKKVSSVFYHIRRTKFKLAMNQSRNRPRHVANLARTCRRVHQRRKCGRAQSWIVRYSMNIFSPEWFTEAFKERGVPDAMIPKIALDKLNRKSKGGKRRRSDAALVSAKESVAKQ